MNERKLAKIRNISLGMGGYQGVQYGISFTLGGDGWGTGDFWGSWGTRDKSAKYSEEEWQASHLKAYFRLKDLMVDAKVGNLNDLVGKPIEVVFENNSLKSWRILTEVL